MLFLYNTHEQAYTCIKSIQKSVPFICLSHTGKEKKIFSNEKNENKKNIYIYSRETTTKSRNKMIPCDGYTSLKFKKKQPKLHNQLIISKSTTYVASSVVFNNK